MALRIIHMTKEGLDQMAEEEAAKKRGGGGPREANIRPEDVRFADYRKKEMVFLPKKKKIPVGKQVKQTQITQAAAHKRVVEMGDTIAIQDFAAQMSVKGVDVIRKLMGMGMMATMNQTIDYDTAALVAGEFEFEVKNVEPGKDVYVVWRMDYVYGDWEAEVEANDRRLANCICAGSDRKFRWRNWVYVVPAENVREVSLRIKLKPVTAGRDINVFKMWAFQPTKRG